MEAGNQEIKPGRSKIDPKSVGSGQEPSGHGHGGRRLGAVAAKPREFISKMQVLGWRFVNTFEVTGMDLLSMFLEFTAEDKVSVFENFDFVKSHSSLGKTHDFTRFNGQLVI